MRLTKVAAICFAALFSFTLLASNADVSLTITSVKSEVLTPSTQDFSIIINLETGNQNINTWKLGFYQPRTYRTIGIVNPNIKMSIINDEFSSQKADLKYSYSKKSDSLSAGYMTVLEPVKAFELQKNSKYTINLVNNNQWAPGNLTAMPQSFFFIITNKDGDNKIINITTSPSTYQVSGYNPEKTALEIKEYNASNIKNSNKINNEMADKLGLIPTPVSIVEAEGYCNIDIKSEIKVSKTDKDSKNAFNYLKTTIKDLKYTKEAGSAVIHFNKLNDYKCIDNNPEGYQLVVNKDGITISAETSAGFFYGVVTLDNLLYSTNGHLPYMTITDYPRFKYRGVLLDLARHFQDINAIEKLIDVMAAQKLNTLHIHFSDDEAFRIGLAGMPFLKKASARGFAKGSILTPEMMPQANLDISNYKNFDVNDKQIEKNYAHANTLYKESYSLREIKKIINYANEREITIIPEIDLPGHARALIYSNPEAFINNLDKSEYISVQGYSDDVIPVCLYGSETKQGKVFTKTIDDIILGISKLFYNQKTIYAINNEVSVGGDEVSAQAWTNDESAVGVWAGKDALQKSIYFFKQLQKQTKVNMSGWQQFVQLNNGTIENEIAVPSNDTAHVWVWNTSQNGISDAVKLANEGYPTVLSFANDTYFDLTYTPDIWEPGFSWAGKFLGTYAALSSASDGSKTLNELSASKKKNILGLEGTLWSESIVNSRHLFYMALPKMTGLAEAAWSPAAVTVDNNNQVDWKSLTKRLGTDNNGYLGYLNKKYKVEYRGYPNGISLEL